MFASIKQFCAGKDNKKCPICRIAEFLGLLDEPVSANIFEEMGNDIAVIDEIIEYSKGM